MLTTFLCLCCQGAKLLHLKETLQQRMKERREQEREKRQMAYNIDNEEMGGGEGEEEEEEEEEAELSDGDMSDEEYRMGAEVDSEEDDEDFNPDDEIVRVRLSFLCVNRFIFVRPWLCVTQLFPFFWLVLSLLY